MPAITVKSIELAESQKKVLAKKYVEIFSEITNRVGGGGGGFYCSTCVS